MNLNQNQMRPITSSQAIPPNLNQNQSYNINDNINENLNGNLNANLNLSSSVNLTNANNANDNINDNRIESIDVGDNDNEKNAGISNRNIQDMSRNSELAYHSHSGDYFNMNDESLDINLLNVTNLTSLTANLSTLSMISDNNNSLSATIDGLENNENLFFYPDNYDDSKEGNISRNVRVPSSEHVAEIVGRQGCKIKDLRARTNTYIKTPMRTQSPVFVVTGKEEAVQQVMQEIHNAAEHFTHIRASRNHHKAGGGLENAKPVSREGDIVMYVTVPYRVVGLVVGLKGQTIKTIQQETDTFIVTPNRDRAPIFEIRGQPENVEKAKSMILTHIEHRTRHCSNRLQDTTNLYDHGSEYSNGEMSPTSPQFSNSPGSALSGSNCSPFETSTIRPRSSFNNGSSPTPQSVNYNGWRSYSSLQDQHPPQTNHMAWSSATNEYSSPMGSNGLSNNSFQQYSASGSTSSPTSSTTSRSPPIDFMTEINMGNQQLSPYGGLQMSSSPSYMKRGNDASPTDGTYSSFPLLTTTQVTSTKGSTVLGNLFPSNKNSLGLMSSSHSGMMSSASMSGFSGPTSDELNQLQSGPLTPVTPLRSGVETGMFPVPLNLEMNVNGLLREREDSGVSCKTPSETSGSQGSPVPKVCKICEEAEITTALVPCGHNHVCMECAKELVSKPNEAERKCPTCNMPVTGDLRIRA